MFDECCFDESFDNERARGRYVFRIANSVIIAPGTWSMVVYDTESYEIYGEWDFTIEDDGQYQKSEYAWCKHKLEIPT